MTSVLVGGCVGCALTRLLRPEESPVLEVLDAWPLNLPDVVGEPASPRAAFRSAPGGGFASGLERLLRPDRQVMLLAICSLDVVADDLLGHGTSLPGEPPAKAQAA